MSKKDSSKMTQAERANLASQVNKVRHERRMTQQDLADAAGVTRQTISNLERGSVPQSANLSKILEALGISVGASNYSSDTEMWLGLIGGVLESLPTANRNRAGQAAMSAVTTELADVASQSNVVPLRKTGTLPEGFDPEAELPHAAYDDTEEPGLPEEP